MKIYRTVCLTAALAISSLALAKMPYNNDAFGKLEGTLDFCAQTDAQSAPKYQKRKKALVRDASEQELAEARASREYRDAYDSTSSVLAKAPKENVVEVCTALLKSDK